MTISQHPSLEDLLLWQSGELSPEEAAEVEDHVASCSQCKSDLSETGELFGDVASLNAEAAQWRMHRRFDQEQSTAWGARFFQGMQRSWVSASAAIVILALILYNFSDLIPAARADALIERAIKQENNASVESHYVRLDVGTLRCFADVGPTRARLVPASALNNCNSFSKKLEGSGWTYSNLLSVKGFQHWRSRLKKKHDSIHKFAVETQIRTSTDDGAVRVATLHLRNSDLRPVSESLEFALDGNGPATTVEIAEPLQTELNAVLSPTAPALVSHENEMDLGRTKSLISPLDVVEAHALLALHTLGAEKDILLNVQRERDTVKVWGVAANDSQKEALLTALRSVADVTTSIRTEDEEKHAPEALPWQPFQGDGAPLAQQQLQGMFSGNPQALQEFVNSLDKMTLQLVAEARFHDALRPLKQRLSATPDNATMTQTERNLNRELIVQAESICRQVQPLTGTINPRGTPLSYPQALALYTLVHQVVYMSSSREPVDLDEALDRIRRLLSGH